MHNQLSDIILCIISLAGTHDIQNISVSSPHPGQVRVTVYFIQESRATGALVIVYSQLDAICYQHLERDGQTSEITIEGLTGGQYRVSVFVSDDTLPFSRAATPPQEFYTNMTQQSMCVCLH